MRNRSRVIIAGVFAAASAAQAADAPDQSLFFGLENDIFAGTDNHYTNGVRLEYTSAPGDVPALVEPLRDAIAPLYGEGVEWRSVWGIGQGMYVPYGIGRRHPPRRNRPYAGWLYGYYGLAAARAGALDIIRADIGVLGPPSLAEPIQKELHEQIGSPRPAGWDSQIETHPTVALSYQRVQRFRHEEEIAGAPARAEFLPHMRLTLGNVDTYAAAGFTFRASWNGADDFGPATRLRGHSGGGIAAPADGAGFSVFAGAEGRAYAHSGLIEGPFFGQGRPAEPENLTGHVMFGAAVSYGSAELSYTHVVQAKEYKAQKSTNPWGAHQFGALNLRVGF
ncbi:MAG: lipid A deacylase LpxR family protein [Pikeienuella sp.]